MTRRLRLGTLALVVGASGACSVIDLSMLAKTTATKVLEGEKLVENQTHANVLRRMGRSLDLFAPLIRYRMPDYPRWRTRWPDGLIENAQAIADALNGGDPGWERYHRITIPIRAVTNDLATLGVISDQHRAAIRRRLALVQYADSVIRASIDLNGRVRAARNPYQTALDTLEALVTVAHGGTQVAGQIAAGTALLNHTTQTVTAMHQAQTDLATLDTLQDREAATPGIVFALERSAAADRDAQTLGHFDDALFSWTVH